MPEQRVKHIANGVADVLKEPEPGFHKNLRFVLDECWPKLDLHEQLRRTWITEGVLCSAHRTGGIIPAEAEEECANRYLSAQIELFRSAFWIALGRKAERRLKNAGRAPNVYARAAGSPTGPLKDARNSWMSAARAFRGWLGDN